MGLDRPDVVDAIGTEKTTGLVILTIMDSWDWEHTQRHLLALQAKINAYLGFVQSGELWQEYPVSPRTGPVINIVFRFDPPEQAMRFLNQVQALCIEKEIGFRYSTWPGSSP